MFDRQTRNEDVIKTKYTHTPYTLYLVYRFRNVIHSFELSVLIAYKTPIAEPNAMNDSNNGNDGGGGGGGGDGGGSRDNSIRE